MGSSWNHPPQGRKRKESGDKFWWGFVPSLLLPVVLNVVIFKIRWTTDENVFYAMWRMAQKGFIGKDMMAALVPSLLLIIIFSAFKKEKASIGSFVGLCPALIIALIYY